jgi:hypothetical protein
VKQPKEPLVVMLTANLEEPEADVCRNVKSGATGRIVGSNESPLQFWWSSLRTQQLQAAFTPMQRTKGTVLRAALPYTSTRRTWVGLDLYSE